VVVSAENILQEVTVGLCNAEHDKLDRTEKTLSILRVEIPRYRHRRVAAEGETQREVVAIERK
jgi:hypothetical protein